MTTAKSQSQKGNRMTFVRVKLDVSIKVPLRAVDVRRALPLDHVMDGIIDSLNEELMLAHGEDKCIEEFKINKIQVS
jgi:hypothetical protein